MLRQFTKQKMTYLRFELGINKRTPKTLATRPYMQLHVICRSDLRKNGNFKRPFMAQGEALVSNPFLAEESCILFLPNEPCRHTEPSHHLRDVALL